VTPSPEIVGVEVIRGLRHAVLRGRDRPVSASHYPQDDLPETFHVAICHDTTAIGCATFFPEPFPEPMDAELSGRSRGYPRDLPDNSARVWRLRGLAVSPQWQGRGLGGSLLRFGLAEIARRGGTQLWCNARTSALDFYRNHGFTVQGEEFLIENGIPHVVALRPVPGAATGDQGLIGEPA